MSNLGTESTRKKKVVAYRADYGVISGSPIRGLILSQLMYWMPRRTYKTRHALWIIKTFDELGTEVGMTGNAVQKQMKNLEDMGLVEYFPATKFGKKHSFIRVVLSKLRQMLMRLKLDRGEKLSGQGVSEQTSSVPKQTAKRRNSQASKQPNGGKQTAKRRNSQASKQPNGGISISESSLSESSSEILESSETERGATPAEKPDDDFLDLMIGLSVESVEATIARGAKALKEKVDRGQTVTNPIAYLCQCLIKQAEAEKRTGVPREPNGVQAYRVPDWDGLIGVRS